MYPVVYCLRTGIDLEKWTAWRNTKNICLADLHENERVLHNRLRTRFHGYLVLLLNLVRSQNQWFALIVTFIWNNDRLHSCPFNCIVRVDPMLGCWYSFNWCLVAMPPIAEDWKKSDKAKTSRLFGFYEVENGVFEDQQDMPNSLVCANFSTRLS